MTGAITYYIGHIRVYDLMTIICDFIHFIDMKAHLLERA